jgi:peptidoglycan/xylan/chitin deacetylase (PgdA/CDA1 family)
MYRDGAIDGSGMRDHTLCLTFDDGPGETSGPGPGPRTLALAQYLQTQRIPATFFMVGKYASDLPGLMPQVESLGHLIANHTYDHPNLPQLRDAGGDAVCQVMRTDGLIRNWIDHPVVFVRPPYGAWDSGIAAELNANLTASLSHVGPVGWDIDGGDWACWKDGRSVSDCVAGYIAEIEAHRRGIVLMHDCTADQDFVKVANRTLELVQLLIPALRQRGYSFVRLDDVPGITKGNESAIRVALRGVNGLYVSPQGGGGGAVIVNGPAVGPWEPIVVEDLYAGKVALRVATGQYISPQGGGGGDVLANGPAVGIWEPLDLISLGANRIALRTVTGHFLTCNTAAGNALDARGVWLQLQAENVFQFEYLP